MSFQLYTPGRSMPDLSDLIAKDPAITDNLIGKMITIDPATGLAIEATAASTELGFCVSDNGEDIQVVADAEAIYKGNADAPFAAINRNTEVDLVINSGVQEIDLGASTTDVFKVLSTKKAGTIGDTTDVRVRINKLIAV